VAQQHLVVGLSILKYVIRSINRKIFRPSKTGGYNTMSHFETVQINVQGLGGIRKISWSILSRVKTVIISEDKYRL
jgi:hypothetical protein